MHAHTHAGTHTVHTHMHAHTHISLSRTHTHTFSCFFFFTELNTPALMRSKTIEIPHYKCCLPLTECNSSMYQFYYLWFWYVSEWVHRQQFKLVCACACVCVRVHVYVCVTDHRSSWCCMCVGITKYFIFLLWTVLREKYNSVHDVWKLMTG